MANTINETVSQAGEQAAQAAQRVREAGRQAFNEPRMESAREYIERGRGALGEASDSLSEFVRREPWLALAGAFVVGYIAAQIIKRMP